MIVGNYYINNVLVVAVLIAAFGGLGLATGAFQSLTSDQGSDASERDLNISLESSDVEAGSAATFTVNGPDGKPVSDARVFVDGSEAGTTSDTGRFRFQVPDSSEVVLRVSAGRSNVTRTLNLQQAPEGDRQEGEETGGENSTGKQTENDTREQTGNDTGEQTGDDQVPENDTSSGNEKVMNETEGDNQTAPEASVRIQELRPSAGDIIGSYAADFNFSVSTDTEASYRVVLDGSIIDRGSLGEGKNFVETDFALGSEGRHTWQVEVDAGNQSFSSKEVDFMLDDSNESSGSDQEEDESAEKVVQFGPSGSISGYRPKFSFDVNNTGLNAESYSVLVDGTEKFSGPLGSGLTSVSEESIIHDSGEHEWSVNLLDGGQNVYSSDNASFSTSQESPPIDISLQSPGEGESITGSEVAFNVSVDSPYNYRFMLFIDGEARYNSSLHSEEEPYLIRRDMSTSGQHNWKARAVADQTGEIFNSSQRSFSTSEGAGFATVDLVYPDDGASGDPGEQGVRFEWEVEAFEQVNYEMVLDGSVEYSSTLEEGLHEFSENMDLSEGEHTWFVRVENGSSTVK
ncbi:MAG: hypothetical protein BRC26_00710, partial [Nanohaloarchaea archaeon QH_8_44_6]